MTNKLDIASELSIDEIWIAKHEHCPNGVIGIEWSGAAGFGRYELILDDNGKLHAHSECMDSNNDKRFIKKLMELLADEAIIDE